MKPISFDEFVSSEEKRREAWTRTFSGVAGWVGARPNAGHYGVARLLASGKASVAVTQNVDNLHQASGAGEHHGAPGGVDQLGKTVPLGHLVILRSVNLAASMGVDDAGGRGPNTGAASF